MTFAELQQQINTGWRQRRHPIDPVSARKHFLCGKCGKKGFRVKMDYLGNRHYTYQITRYNIDYYRCPKCGHVFPDWSRIEGRGKRGTNLGKLYGSK